MIKKTLLFLLALLPALANAQQAVGSWYFYPLYNGVPDRVIDTPELTYYLSLGRLYSYDKQNDESREYIDLLNDRSVTVIDYNPARGFLFVGYENGNIDLLYDNGRVVNMPDIREAQIASDKGINEVDFNDNLVYVATKFGLVIFDAGQGVVRQSGIYGKDVKAVGAQGDYIIINTDNRNYGIKRTELISRFENFKELDEMYNVAEIKGMGDYVLIRTDNLVRGARYTFPEGKLNIAGIQTQAACTSLMRCGDGKIRTVSGGIVYAYGKDGERTQESAIPSLISNNAYGMWRGCSDVWAANADGVGCYDITGQNMTVKTDRILPSDAISMSRVAFIEPSADGSRIYLGTCGWSNINPAAQSNALFNMSVITDEGIKDVTPRVGLTNNTNSKISQLSGVDAIAVNPDDPDMVMISTWQMGNYAVKDGKQVAKFNSTNSTIPSYWGHGICFDDEGNMWTMTLDLNSKCINVLPAEKLKKNLSSLTASDWVSLPVEGFKGNSDGVFAFIPGSDLFYLKCSLASHPIVVYDTRGTLKNNADDKHRLITSYIDQDGKTFSNIYKTVMKLDNAGALWVGTENGIFSYDRPQDGLSADMRITRMKVPRNDGTNFADYLLDGECITAIAVDGSNNKWLGTSESGLYYVNSDGSEILEHFTSDNSPLPDNAICSLYCDPGSNDIYVGTNYGLLRYSGFHSPGKQDYSEVYAYPNPVKPGYSGWITVTGLMDNSLVKIADASGSVVFQGRSEGGMFTWDGCNSAGSRVKSGVYYVFASQSANGSSEAAVTKILIMN